MLCGPLAEKDHVKIPDVSDTIFRDFLMFMYTDHADLTAGNVTGLLYLAKKYAVGGLEKMCLTNLETSLSTENACTILEQAHGFDEKTLYDKALEVVVTSGDASLCCPGFPDLCHDCLDKVIGSDRPAATPEKVFSAALLWAEAECRRQGRDITPDMKRLVLGETIYDISFPAMEMKEFVKTVVPSGILTHEENTKIFSYFACPDLGVSPFKLKLVNMPNRVLFFDKENVIVNGNSIKEGIKIACSNNITVKSSCSLLQRAKHIHVKCGSGWLMDYQTSWIV